MNPPAVAYVAIGANLGNPVEKVREAIQNLGLLPHTRLLRASSLYLTAPMGLSDQPDFVNAVAALETRLSPQEMLEALLTEEQHQGRIRSIANAPRTLDLDLLLHGESVIDTPHLTLPHPRLHLRAFVLIPLAEIAPHLKLSGRGTVAAWLPAVAGQHIRPIP
ncbi:MAG: 2-amino-4-hydroxy-6-hydroxymethyldihydropteridine diphosphokinase [Azovibrio sp.]